MRHQVIGGALVALALIAGSVTPVQAQPDAKAAEILAGTRKAIGDKKLDALKTFSVEAAMQRNIGNRQMQNEIEMFFEMPDKYVRSEVSSGAMNMNMNTGFNGDRAILPAGARAMPGGGFMIISGSAPPGAIPHEATAKPTPEEAEQVNKISLRNYRHDVSRLLLGWFGSVHPSLKAKYTYAGEAESPDGKAYVIDVKDEEGFAARLFIDQVSRLPLMVTYQGRQGRMVTSGPPPAGAPPEERRRTQDDMVKQMTQATLVEFSYFFEDWREVDGINFPHKIRRASAGETSEEWTINKVKVNAKIDPKKFAVEGK